jgi:hypothetical protein
MKILFWHYPLIQEWRRSLNKLSYSKFLNGALCAPLSSKQETFTSGTISALEHNIYKSHLLAVLVPHNTSTFLRGPKCYSERACPLSFPSSKSGQRALHDLLRSIDFYKSYHTIPIFDVRFSPYRCFVQLSTTAMSFRRLDSRRVPSYALSRASMRIAGI